MGHSNDLCLRFGAPLGMRLRFHLWHLLVLVAVVAVGMWFVLHSDYFLVYTSEGGWRYGRWQDVFE